MGPSATGAAWLAFPWLESRGRDLFWYIGSPLLGLLYLPLIYFGGRWLETPAGLPLYQIQLFGTAYPVTVLYLVMTSWALCIDGPHFWPTLVRTVFDRDEWTVRGAVLRKSFLFFLLGPLLILVPYLFGRSGGPLLLTVFLSWAYYHVVRQHWGFVRLYQRKGGEHGQELQRQDRRFFNFAMFIPPFLFLTGPHFQTVGFYPDFGLHVSLFRGFSVSTIVFPVLCVLYLGNLLLYGKYLIDCRRAAVTLNGSKLSLYLVIVPLHLLIFAHPLLPIFSQVLVGVGHAFQYQRIVWLYGHRKYHEDQGIIGRVLFRNAGFYFLGGLLFTILLLRGPLIERLIQSVDAVLGVQLVAAFFMGWLFQHYYLDAKIWRVAKDTGVQKKLGV